VDSCQGGLLSRRDAPDFVPVGPDDRSQAIYCLEYTKKRRAVPEERCESGYTTYSPPMVETPCRPNHTVPYETGSLSGTLQAINCLATIIPSLRDKDSQHMSTNSTPDHGKPRRAISSREARATRSGGNRFQSRINTFKYSVINYFIFFCYFILLPSHLSLPSGL
jgi:hypothetical protein